MRFIVLFLTVATLSSCKPDACKDVNCNNGTCETGNCICDPGYEGFNCEVEQRLAFVGDYAVEESCDLGDYSYMIHVLADPENATELIISNLGDFGFEITATVDGTTLTITDQTDNGRTVNGSGELSNGTLTISYTMETTSEQTLNCSMSCTPI